MTFNLRCMSKKQDLPAFFLGKIPVLQLSIRKYENGTRQNNQIVRIKFDRIGHNFIFFESMLEFFR